MQLPGVTLRVLKMKPLKKVGEDRGKKDKYWCTQSGLNTSRQWNNVFHSDLLGAYFKSKLIKNFLRPDQVFLFYTSMVADRKLAEIEPAFQSKCIARDMPPKRKSNQQVMHN